MMAGSEDVEESVPPSTTVASRIAFREYIHSAAAHQTTQSGTSYSITRQLSHLGHDGWREHQESQNALKVTCVVYICFKNNLWLYIYRLLTLESVRMT